MFQLGDAEFARREEAFARLLDLGAADPEGTLAALQGESPDPEVRVRCRDLRRRIPREGARRRALAAVGEDAPLRQTVEDLFAAPSPETLGGLGRPLQHPPGKAGPGVVEIFCGHLTDPDPAMREAAVQWLTVLGAKPSVDRVLPLLSDPEASVRVAAVRALAALGERPQAAPRLLALLENERFEVREAAVFALSQMAEKSAGAGFCRLLSDPEPRVRYAALRGLGELADPALTRWILACAASTDPNVRVTAVRALGRAGDRAAVGPLLKLLDTDENPSVRWHAVEALGELKASDASPRIAGFLSDEDLGLRLCAVSALARIGGRENALRLAGLLPEGDLKVRCAALEALGALKEGVAVPAVAGLLSCGLGGIEQTAARVLRSTVGGGWTDGAREEVPAARAWWEEHKGESEWGESGVRSQETGGGGKE